MRTDGYGAGRIPQTLRAAEPRRIAAEERLPTRYASFPIRRLIFLEKINEIHGAWYDPSNPVVQFSESLRSDLFRWMLKLEESVDLTLALGTSLSGMNADRMAITPSKKARMGKALGTIVINLQRTRMDAKCTIRVWAKLDDAFRILAQKLGTENVLN